MPTLKKRSGKTTITLYAQEERQIQGAIETLKFIELNGDGHLGSNAGVLSSGLGAILTMLPKKQSLVEALEESETEGDKPPY